MINLGKESKLLPEEVKDKAIAFFGPSGVGLKVVDQAGCCARFEGGGGYVYVQAAEVDGREGSNVTVDGREWEYQIKQFAARI
jgi:hypothetical protein